MKRTGWRRWVHQSMGAEPARRWDALARRRSRRRQPDDAARVAAYYTLHRNESLSGIRCGCPDPNHPKPGVRKVAPVQSSNSPKAFDRSYAARGGDGTLPLAGCSSCRT